MRRRRNAGGDGSAAPLAPGALAAVASRLDIVDAARGGALCLMVAYHFCFDLRLFGRLAADFEHDPFWLGARALILSSFLALAGVSLTLAERARLPAAHYWRRLCLLAGCAALVSLGSWVAFPRSFIYFGVLHCIAATTLLARPLLRFPGTALAIGVGAIVAGNTLAHPLFDQTMLSFIGLRTTKPPTDDYVPLLPWSGVALVGMGAAGALLTRSSTAALTAARAPRSLVLLGRHSLAIYMLHQPLLLALLGLTFGIDR